jgi:hypothetical protein
VIDFEKLKQQYKLIRSQFSSADLRWSYIVVALLVLVSIVINVILKEGWTIWPFTAEIVAVVVIHEIAERHGEGVAPIKAYVFAFGVLAAWLGVSILLSVTNPLIILLGMGALIYFCGRGYMRLQAKLEIINHRVNNGLCVHCGEPAHPDSGVCEHCGCDPNPSDSQLKRVQAYSSKNRNPAHMRAVLKQDSLSASAHKKEQALLARRRANRPGRR